MAQINTRELLLQPHHYAIELDPPPPFNKASQQHCCPNRYRGVVSTTMELCNQPIIDTIRLLKQPHQPNEEGHETNIIDTVSYLKYPHENRRHLLTESCQQVNCFCQTSPVDSTCQCAKPRSTKLIRAANLINENLYVQRSKAF